MSSDLAKKFHSLNFGDIDNNGSMDGLNTWDDWKLFPVNRPVFVMPEVKEVTIDIPGSNGELDLSEALTGKPVYKNRRSIFKFRMYNDGRTISSKKADIANYLHGKYMQVISDDEPDYYYEGRFTISDFKYKKENGWADIEISYNLKPFKYEIKDSTGDWLWDPFNFETGVIRRYDSVEVDGTKTITVIGTDSSPIPTIYCSSAMELTYVSPDLKSSTYSLAQGNNIITALAMSSGTHTFAFEGNGYVSVVFRGSSL